MREFYRFNIFLALSFSLLLITGCATKSAISHSYNPNAIPPHYPNWKVEESPFYPLLLQTKGTGLNFEKAKIKYLLGHTRLSTEYQYNRNGHLFNSKTTGNHLERKYKAVIKQITTAEEFIDHIATASSESGKPYYAVDKDGHSYRTGTMLHYELKRLEKVLHTT